MQTFLPYPDFDDTARALDAARLGKQRVEALQVVRALTRPTYGWQHHPAVRMWRGHTQALGAYGLAICREWQRRGHADTCETKIVRELVDAGRDLPPCSMDDLRHDGLLPPWLGDDRVHRSHRSALLRKDPAWYGPRFTDVPPDLPYFWPVGAPPIEPAD